MKKNRTMEKNSQLAACFFIGTANSNRRIRRRLDQ